MLGTFSGHIAEKERICQFRVLVPEGGCRLSTCS